MPEYLATGAARHNQLGLAVEDYESAKQAEATAGYLLRHSQQRFGRCRQERRD